MSEFEKRRSRQSGAESRNRQMSAERHAQIARENIARQARNNSSKKRRRRRSQDRLKGVLLLILVLAVVAVCITVGKKIKDKLPEETTLPPETVLEKTVSVDGISITGLLKEDAREKILNEISWNMKITYGDSEREIPNLMEEKVDEILDEIFKGEPKENYEISTENLDEKIEEEVKAAASAWDVPAKNGAISSFDVQTGKFVFSGEENGTVINQEQLTADIKAAVKGKKYSETIAASSVESIPEITEAQAREKYKIIGTYTTKTTSNKDRNTNILIASQALNGVIIQPGEEFSFNETTGNRTVERGYKAAGAYVNGVLVEEPGGGVCQVSSTLYNSVVFSGLKTTERHAHSYEPSYVTPGEDAMVSYDGYAGPDMKFKNNSKDSVGIMATFSKQSLTVSIYGIPILEEGVTLSMESEKVSDIEPPVPTYEEDQTLQLDEEVTAKAATMGSKWVTRLITKKNGETVSNEFFHNSTYKGKAAIIKRNTSGVVIPAETAETPAPETSAAESTAPVENESTAQNGPGGEVPPETTGQSGPSEETTQAPQTETESTIIAPSPLS